MSIEMLDATLSLDRGDQNDDEPAVPMHEVRHDLDAFYMVLVSLCLLFERPHQPKGLWCHREPSARYLRPNEVLPEACNEHTLRDRFLTFSTRMGFWGKISPCLSPYFQPIGQYLERIRRLIYGDHEWHQGRYKRPPTSPSHDKFLDILHSAMREIRQRTRPFPRSSSPRRVSIHPSLLPEYGKTRRSIGKIRSSAPTNRRKVPHRLQRRPLKRTCS